MLTRFVQCGLAHKLKSKELAWFNPDAYALERVVRWVDMFQCKGFSGDEVNSKVLQLAWQAKAEFFVNGEDIVFTDDAKAMARLIENLPMVLSAVNHAVFCKRAYLENGWRTPT